MREAHRRTSDERRRRSRSGGRSRRRSRSRSLGRSRRRRSSRSRSRSPRRRDRSRSRRRSRSPRGRRRRPSTSRSRSPRRAQHRRFRSNSPQSPAHRRFRSRSGSPVRREQPMASIGDHVKAAAAGHGAGDDAAAAHHGHGGTHGRSRGRRGGKGPKVSIPKNWTDVAKMGGVVGTSRFVPIRVPLDDKYAHHFQRDAAQQWSPRLFLEEQAVRSLDVRLVIDLTNTFKYYDGAAEFRGSGVEYVKLKIEGFHAPPHDRDVARFTEIVDAFLAREPAGTVAVHCTHGLNRTGYLVVTYMVQRLGCSVTEALAAFSDARPPGLIKHMYVEDLYRRLGRDGEEVQLPTLPDWAEEKYAKRGPHH